MKKLTPILTLYYTANFLEEGNSTGAAIDRSPGRIFQLVPVPSLAGRISTLNGQLVMADHYTSLLLPFDFSVNPPATPAGYLPAQLLFYIIIADIEKARFCGLDFDRRLLFLSPQAGTANYTFNQQTIACKPCGSGAVLAAGDLVPHIPATVSLAGLQSLIQQPLGDASRLLDLKAIVNATEIVITKDEHLKLLHTALQDSLHKTVSLSFHKHSDNSVIKNFPKILVTDNALPAAAIGMVSIPVAALTLNDSNPLHYAGLNNFIVHFPAVVTNIALTVNTPQFDGSAKLLLDGQEATGVAFPDHPQMPGYKQVTGTVNNYTVYLNKSKQVTIQNGTKKNNTPVNPMNNYNPKTNTATITITK